MSGECCKAQRRRRLAFRCARISRGHGLTAGLLDCLVNRSVCSGVSGDRDVVREIVHDIHHLVQRAGHMSQTRVQGSVLSTNNLYLK